MRALDFFPHKTKMAEAGGNSSITLTGASANFRLRVELWSERTTLCLLAARRALVSHEALERQARECHRTPGEAGQHD